MISCLGSAAAKPPDVQAVGAKSLIVAMRAHGLRRLVSFTGSGAQLPGEALTQYQQIKRKQIVCGAPHLLADGDQHLAHIAGSDLAWTVIRVPFMTPLDRRHHYVIQVDAPHPAATVTYDNAAQAMLELALNNPLS